ncbi:sensor histidine kinase [Abyssisolibacter fermentans]|uniref:sensor histidine kinase n=1 Tax=Abyssisolibacter fermentans TaxID=1766203 RepID=UPI000833CAD1|nr:HAMP domain-containing sensor histidine kinase [Abyssisolibacter fermentans]
MISITKQLKKYFIIIALVSVVFITLISNIGMNYFFKNYVENTRQKNDLKLIEYIEEVYEYSHKLNQEVMHNIFFEAHNEGLDIKIKNIDNETIFDSQNYFGMGMGMGKGYRNNRNKAVNLEYKTYPLYNSKQKIGSVEIGRPASIFVTSEDISFVYAINGIYIVAFVFSIIVAVLISLYASKKFLNPILLIKNNVTTIADEKYNLNKVSTNTQELHELSKSIEQLATRLENQENLRKRLTSDVAHELRTPLSTLQSHLEALIDGIWEPTPERLTVCYDEILRLTKLIKDLSDLSSIESTDIKLNKQDIDLSKLLNNVVENFIPLMMNKQIMIEKDIETDIHFFGDIDRLNQVFVNLLSNAYKYTEKSGKVLIKLNNKNKKITFFIQDTGIGIKKDDIPYIFERFYRGDVSRCRKTGGTGIGLTIVKALVEAHGGKIMVESEPNAGTTFMIQF